MSFAPPHADMSAAEISHVMGLIYDCAIDPEHWPDAIAAICEITEAASGGISVLDANSNRLKFASQWGIPTDRFQALNETYGALSPIWTHLDRLVVNEPVSTRALVGESAYTSSRFHAEWAEPAGYQDLVGTLLVRNGRSFGTFALTIGVDREPVCPADLETVALLVPHVRRAVLIGDLLDMRAIESSSLGATLDLLAAPVLLTDGEARIVYANTAANRLLRAGDPIASEHGRLKTGYGGAALSIERAIRQTVADETGIGGIAVPVPFADGRPGVAHVLPLTQSLVRSRLEPAAKAAIFISTDEEHQAPVDAVVALYDLTVTEGRVLASVLAGRNQAETATHLGIAGSTVKTHLGRIFSKTGTGNQAELVQLAERLAGRLSGPALPQWT